MTQDIKGRATAANVTRVTCAAAWSVNILVGMGVLLTACDAGNVTDPTVGSRGGPLIPSANHSPWGTGFWEVDLDGLLHENGWTRIVRWPSGGQAILGDWRVKTVPGSLGGRAVQLENPPVDPQDARAIRWDFSPSPPSAPPLDILTHLWIPPATTRARVGVAWFIQEPDATGRLNAFALVRNELFDNGFAIVRYYDNDFAAIWDGTRK